MTFLTRTSDLALTFTTLPQVQIQASLPPIQQLCDVDVDSSSVHTILHIPRGGSAADDIIASFKEELRTMRKDLEKEAELQLMATREELERKGKTIHPTSHHAHRRNRRRRSREPPSSPSSSSQNYEHENVASASASASEGEYEIYSVQEQVQEEIVDHDDYDTWEKIIEQQAGDLEEEKEDDDDDHGNGNVNNNGNSDEDDDSWASRIEQQGDAKAEADRFYTEDMASRIEQQGDRYTEDMDMDVDMHMDLGEEEDLATATGSYTQEFVDDGGDLGEEEDLGEFGHEEILEDVVDDDDDEDTWDTIIEQQADELLSDEMEMEVEGFDEGDYDEPPAEYDEEEVEFIDEGEEIPAGYEEVVVEEDDMDNMLEEGEITEYEEIIEYVEVIEEEPQEEQETDLQQQQQRYELEDSSPIEVGESEEIDGNEEMQPMIPEEGTSEPRQTSKATKSKKKKKKKRQKKKKKKSKSKKSKKEEEATGKIEKNILDDAGDHDADADDSGIEHQALMEMNMEEPLLQTKSSTLGTIVRTLVPMIIVAIFIALMNFYLDELTKRF